MRRGQAAGHGVIEWLSDPALPWLHFAHATGMCAELYAALLAPLAAEFNIVASDARGHGAATLAADPAALAAWRTYQDDLAALLTYYGERRWLLAGHSMGASVSIELAARQPALAGGVVLVEPAFVPFAAAAAWDAARAQGTASPNPMAAQAARRRADFPDAAAARAQWAGRGVFRDWPDAALDAYLRGGLRAAPGGVTLACTPAWEAATFAAVTSSLEEALRAWRGPLALVYGTAASTVIAPDAAVIAALHPAAPVTRIDGASHFLPLTHAAEVHAAIRAVTAGTC